MVIFSYYRICSFQRYIRCNFDQFDDRNHTTAFFAGQHAQTNNSVTFLFASAHRCKVMIFFLLNQLMMNVMLGGCVGSGSKVSSTDRLRFLGRLQYSVPH